MMRRPSLVACMVVLVAGCGGETAPDDGAGDADTQDDAADAARDASLDAPEDAAADAASETDAVPADAARDAATDASFACGSATCAGGAICVRTYTTGGACLLCGDGGACPGGSHCGGQCCVVDTPSYSFACKPAPAGCSSALSCAATCGGAVCGAGPCPCESASAGVVTCHCLAP